MSYAVSPSMSDDERDIDIESDVSWFYLQFKVFQCWNLQIHLFLLLKEEDGQGYSRGSGQYSQQVVQHW